MHAVPAIWTRSKTADVHHGVLHVVSLTFPVSAQTQSSSFNVVAAGATTQQITRAAASGEMRRQGL
jgi:hypothetical protein